MDSISVVVIFVALLMLSSSAFSHLPLQSYALVHQQRSCGSLAFERMPFIVKPFDGPALSLFEALPSLR